MVNEDWSMLNEMYCHKWSEVVLLIEPCRSLNATEGMALS
jgi:hypothetical protein